MGFPNPPDFRSAEPFAAWWGVMQGNNALRLCATQGMSFIKRLQRRLAAKLGRDIPQTGAWDDATAQGLSAAAAQMATANPGSGWGVTADQIRGATQTREIPSAALRYGIYVAYLEGTDNTFDNIQLRPDTIFPTYGVAPNNDLGFGLPDGGATCWFPASQSAPTASQPSPQAGGSGSGGGTGGQTAGSQLTLGMDQAQMSMVVPVVAIGVGVAALGTIWYLTRKPKRSSKKSSKRSKRAA